MSLTLEVASAYLKALQDGWAHLLVAMLVAVSLAGILRLGLGRLSDANVSLLQKPVSVALLIVSLAAGLPLVVDQAACFDDAYISLRYASNLTEGHGLVFNVGERVEGYTNFLWTLILAAGMWLTDIEGPMLAVGLCGLCYIANTLVVARLGAKLVPRSARIHIPVAACIFALHPLIISYGTSGLETQFASLLVNVALLFWIEAKTRRALALGGFTFILTTFTRPDHGLFFGIGGLVLVVEVAVRLLKAKPTDRAAFARSAFFDLIAYAAPFALYAAYLGWKFWYYGSLVPNTYYAKSADLAYWSQGWAYVAEFGLSSHLFLALPWVMWLLFVSKGDEKTRRFFAFVAPGVLLYSVYVAKVGGDFMHGRFFVTLVPLLLLGLEHALARALRFHDEESLRWQGWLQLTVIAAVVGLTAVPVDLIGKRGMRWGIAQESDYYQIDSWEPVSVDHFNHKVALIFRDLTEAGHPPRAAVKTVGMPAFYGKGYILDRRGLTDAHVARLTLARRGRPGHEKLAEPSYVASRNVHFMDSEDCPLWFNDATRLKFSGVQRVFSIQRYDTNLMEALRSVNPGVRFTPAPKAIDHYIDGLRIRTPERVATHLKWLRRYYFDHNEDPKRLRILESYAAGDRSVAPGYHEALRDPDDESQSEATVAFAGDAILARSVNTLVSQHGAKRVLKGVKSLIESADLSVVNLECVLASDGMHSSLDQFAKAYLRGRPELVEVLTRAGVDVASFANNHGGDYGPDALRQSMSILSDAGISPLGAGNDLEQSRRPVVKKVGPYSIGFVGVQTTSDYSMATPRRGGTNYLSLGDLDSAIDILAQQVDEARRTADVVFLLIHWGPNNRERPDKLHREFARRAVREAGIDALLGSSSHMLQGIEVIDGRPIIYDAGNLVLDWADYGSWTHKSGVFTLHVGSNGVTRVDVDPILLHHGRTEIAPRQVASETLNRLKMLSTEMGTTLLVQGRKASLSLSREAPPEPLSEFKDKKERKRKLPKVPPAISSAVVSKLPPSATPWTVQFEGGIELVGGQLPKETQLRLGLNVATYWTTNVKQEGVHEIFFEVVPTSSGKRWPRTEEHEPADWMYPSSWWKPGEIVLDFFHIKPNGTLKEPTSHEVFVGIKLDGRPLKPTGKWANEERNAVSLGTVVLR